MIKHRLPPLLVLTAAPHKACVSSVANTKKRRILSRLFSFSRVVGQARGSLVYARIVGQLVAQLPISPTPFLPRTRNYLSDRPHCCRLRRASTDTREAGKAVLRLQNEPPSNKKQNCAPTSSLLCFALVDKLLLKT